MDDRARQRSVEGQDSKGVADGQNGVRFSATGPAAKAPRTERTVGWRGVFVAALVLAVCGLTGLRLAAQQRGRQVDLRSLLGTEPEGEPLAEMEFENPLMTEDEETAFRRSPDPRQRPAIFIFHDALKSMRLNDSQRKAIVKGVRWYIARFTMPKYRTSLYRLRREIQRELHLYAKNSSPREFFLGELTKAAEEIIEPRKFRITHDHGQDITIEITEYDDKGNEQKRTVKAKDVNELESMRQKDPVAVELYERYANRTLYFGGNGGPQPFLVRINAILLLTELDSKEGDPMKGVPPVPYVPASQVLLRVMNDPGQRMVYRIPAAKGLARICLYSGIPRSDKLRATVVDVFVRELRKPDSHWWYRKVLVEGLASTGVLFGTDRGGVPVVAQTLAEKITDPKEVWQVRSAAARAIARAALDSKIETKPIIYAIVDLARQMALQYNKRPAAYPWMNCFLDIYLAFKPVSPQEKTSDGRRTAGFLADGSASRMAEEAYNAVLPVIRFVLHDQGRNRIPGDRLAALTNWLKQNRPESLSIVPNGRPIMPASATRNRLEHSVALR